MIAAAAGALLFTGMGAWLASSLRPSVPATTNAARPTRFKLSLPSGTTPTDSPAISKDGRLIALVLTRDNVNQLHVLDLTTDEWQSLPGTDGAREPFFSPDAQAGRLRDEWQADADVARGRSAGQICTVADMRGGSWGDDDQIVFGTQARGLMRVAATGGTPTAITAVNESADESGHRYPFLLPNGGGVVFTVMTRDNGGRIAATRGSSSHWTIVPDGFNPIVVASHLLFVKSDGDLHAVRFDPETLAVRGVPVALLERPKSGAFLGDVALRVASNGTAVWLPNVRPQRRLAISDRHGSIKPLPIRDADYQGPSDFSRRNTSLAHCVRRALECGCLRL